MILRQSSPETGQRRGVILLVVLALLTLFAVVGIAFVFYSQTRADAARVYRESQMLSAVSGPDVPPQTLLDEFLRQWIFDVYPYTGTAPQKGHNSALRGNSLARSMFGGIGPGTSNTVAFSGTGRLHTAPTNPAVGSDDYLAPNYTYFSADGGAERQAEVFSNGRANFSSSYTYPDLNTMCLAAVNSQGKVLIPSYHRPWLFNPTMGLNNAANLNWTSQSGKYMIMRPRPQENPGGFPMPTGAMGDVQNLLGNNMVGGGSGPDSIWIDLGSTLQALSNGTVYKPLYAPLIVDLDNRININLAGNVHGSGTTHVSDSGMGPWEMNLSYVLNSSAAPTEWTKLLLGNGTTNGRYGTAGQPVASTFANSTVNFNNSAVNLNSSASGSTSGSTLYLGVGTHFNGFYDYDGCNETTGYTATTPIPLPASGSNFAFPITGPNPYANPNIGYGNGSATELANHSQLYNVFQPGAGNSNPLGASNMFSLLYVGPGGNNAAASTVGKLLPNNVKTQSICNLITTYSWDVDQPGVTPWMNDSTFNYTLAAGTVFPSGGALPFSATTAETGVANTEFSTTYTGTAADALLLPRLDLSNPYFNGTTWGQLPDYPQVNTTDGCIPQAQQAAYTTALTARQQMAANIYVRLVNVTGAYNQFTSTSAPSQAQFDALRYLAQLSVNIVDFIDNDNYMTPFNWAAIGTGSSPAPTSPAAGLPPTGAAMTGAVAGLDLLGQGWVFGVEPSPLVLNEVYAEIDNDTNDPKNNYNGMTKPAGWTGSFNLNFWVELLNTNQQDATLANYGTSTSVPLMQNPSASGWTQGKFAAYHLMMTLPNQNLRSPINVRGVPDNTTANAYPGITAFTAPTVNGVALSSNGKPSNVLLTVADWTPDGNAVLTAPATTTCYGVAATTASPPSYTAGASLKNTVYYVAGPSSNTYTSQSPTVAGTLAPAGAAAISYTNPVSLQTSVASNPAPVPAPTPAYAQVAGATPSVTPAQFTDPYTGNKYNSGMSYYLTQTQYTAGTAPAKGGNAGKYDVLLRRLACPTLPPNNTVSSPLYNPYVTVDYVQSVQAYDGVQYVQGNSNASTAVPPGTMAVMNTRFSMQKQQPYASASSQWSQSQTGQPNANQPNNSFFGKSGNAAPTPLWLTHLDRLPVSPMELLQVCGFKPHELTQQFITTTVANVVDSSAGSATANTYNYQHRAPWTGSNANFARIYRLFEFLEVKSRAGGVQLGGRVPGKININTIWDVQTFQALCDSQSVNGTAFTTGDVTNVFNSMVASRTPGANSVPGATDLPFMGMATGYDKTATQYTGSDGRSGASASVTGIGINNTLLRPSTSNPGLLLFEGQSLLTAGSVGSSYTNHPALRDQLITKMANNVTTRSNVFALWLTVGFFQVTNTTTVPVQLGAELTQPICPNVRHSMFAIVDRTTLGVPGTTAVANASNAVTKTGNNTVTLTSMPASVIPGSVLMVDTGNNQESVVVKTVNGTSFTATFNMTHLANFPIYSMTPGNPGPQPKFTAKNSSALVPFYTVID